MTGKEVEVRSANEAVIVRERRVEVAKGSAAEVKNANVAGLEVENVDSEAVTEVPSM